MMKFTLIATDERPFSLPIVLASYSQILTHVITKAHASSTMSDEGLSKQTDDLEITIPLPFDSITIEYVVEYLKYKFLFEQTSVKLPVFSVPDYLAYDVLCAANYLGL